MPLSEYADWWDGEKRQSEKILNDWVQDNPQWWVVFLATGAQTSMDLGAGFVDVLRLGEGAAKGGVTGWGQDGLRVLMLLGPLARAGGVASRFLTPLLRSGNLRVAVQVAGVDGPCTFQAVNNAVAIMRGKNLFVTVADMARGMGTNLSKLKLGAGGLYELSAWIDELVPFLRQAGVRVKEVGGLTQVEQVVALAQRETGPVIFAIRTTVRNGAGATEEILHSVIAMRTPTGAVQFADYGGKFVRSLPELVKNLGYGTPTTAIELLQSGSSAAIIDGARLTGEFAMKLTRFAIVLEGLAAIQTTENGVEMAVPANLAAADAPRKEEKTPTPAVVVKGSFDAYKSRVNGRPVIRLPEMVITAGKPVAPQADWLTGVQFRLNALGFGAGPVDGIIGPLTRRAVRRFQQTYPPLAVDEIPGPRTQAKLVEICGY